MNKEQFIGNGNMLLYLQGSEISEIYAGGYTSAPFLGINSDFGELYDHTQSERINSAATLRHSIFSRIYHNFSRGDRITKIIEDARMVDLVSCHSDIFIRYCENIRPFSLNFSIAPYVRKSLYKGYRIGRKNYDVLCLVLPKGVGFYKNLSTAKETKMLVIADGDAKLTADGNSVDILAGKSRLIFVSGSGEDCLKNARIALDDGSYFEGSSKIADESESCVSEILSRTDNEDEKEALLLLLAHQAREGGVLASHSEMVIRMQSVKQIVGAFLKFGLADRARRALEFFCNRFKKDKTFYQVYGSFDSQYEQYFSNFSLSCARLMSAMLDFAQYIGSPEFIKENFAMMKSAMYAQLGECSLGMMPFSGAERDISDEILGCGVQLHGSLEATVESADAILRFTEFCKENSLVLHNDSGSAERRARAMLESAVGYFAYGSRVSLNAPERESSVKKPRFVYGDCDMCRRSLSNVYYGELELSGQGIYVCPSCYRRSEDDELHLKGEKCFTPQASGVLLSNKRVRELIGDKRAKEILCAALKERRENRLVRSAASDMTLLSLVQEFSLSSYKEFLERSIKDEIVGKSFPRTLRGQYAVGRLDSEIAARFLLMQK